MGSGNGPPQRPDDVDLVVGPQGAEPLGAGADRGDHDVDGAAVGAGRADLVDREAPSQQVRAGVAADRQGHELAGAGQLGQAGRHEGEVVVGAGPPGGDQLAGHLHDARSP